MKLARAMANYSGIKLFYGKPLGVHEAIVDILMERMSEQSPSVAEDATVLIVGRGSSDLQTKHDFEEIMRLFKAKTKLTDVNVCFLAAAEPLFEQELKRLANQQPAQLWIIPYLLFTGILMKKMKKTIHLLNNANPVILCNYLGYHPFLRRILIDRIQEISLQGVKRKSVSNHG
jgi:sirohydrochlorin ferrochelatase